MFSPITQRSLKVRLLYIAVYALLLMGAATMVLPFLVMLTGSMEPRSEIRNSIVPGWLINKQQLWNRYLETKYRDSPDLLRMAWGDPDADFRNQPVIAAEDGTTKAWSQFLSETQPPPTLYTPGFLRQNTRMPSYLGREFRIWLLKQYDNDLSELNRAFGERFSKITAIAPPTINITDSAVAKTRFNDHFYAFCSTLPQSRLIPWDVGGYYRAVFLPKRLGNDIAIYNQKYGTDYTSYQAVPFPGRVPEVGREDWFFFVTKILRPDFVTLSKQGEERREPTGVTKEAYIRTSALAEELRITSLDVLFSEWCASRGIAEQRIPQQENDRAAFEAEAGFWKRAFLTMNYLRVLDELLLHGRAIYNTIILITLSVIGALIVNPLAAYALSRFRLRKTYFILLFCLATIAFPAEVTMIPVFLQMKEFHLLNTFGALVLPTVASGFSIFLLKGFFDSLPKELYEAAEIDGASEWMMFWQITINLSKPILAVIALGAFTAAYGAYFYALILAPDPKMWTIMVEIYQLRQTVDPPVVYASLIITAIPTLVMFIFCQNLILRGIVVPSEK
jgi:multiple sugar transport system permease protein